MTVSRLFPSARMSQIVKHGDTLYLAGQVPNDCSASIKGQTEQVLQKIDTLLAEVGVSKSAILSAQIWLSDIADFDGMNAVWDDWVDRSNPPARATCQARLARPQARIEILVTAAAVS